MYEEEELNINDVDMDELNKLFEFISEQEDEECEGQEMREEVDLNEDNETKERQPIEMDFSALEQEIKKVEFAKVCGYIEVKEELKRILTWFSNKDLVNDPKVVLPKGVLLYGPPGCGKTLFVRELKNGFKYPAIVVEGKSDNVAGEVVEAFQKAKKEEFALVIIDELDLLVANNNKVARVLQQEMDGVNDAGNILVLATANKIYDIPEPLLRPGRLDRKIKVGRPDTEARKEMITNFLGRLDVDVTNINIPRLAKTLTTNASTIQAICNDAYLRCGTDVTTKEIEKSYNRIERGNLVDAHQYKNYTVAVHEAGHVVAALVAKDNFEFYEATFADYGGFTETNNVDENADTIVKREEQVVLCLAGYIAEEEIIGHHDVGSYGDYQKAHDLCVRFTERVCVNGLYHLIPAYDGNDKRYESRLKRFVNEIHTDKMLRKFIRRTRKMVRKNKDAIKQIADIMMKKGSCNYEDVKDITITA